MTTFAELGLRPELLSALTTLGYEEPTPIQADAIPELLAGRDVLGQAATGTGKTAAFALPALQLVDGPPGRPIALVLVPTRELAVQVSEAIYKYGRGLRARVLPIYGGQPIGRQLGALRDGVHAVVATPGRAIDHINRGTLRLDDVRLVVLDEADEMLDMGFAEDIDAILEATPESRQTVLFSATMPPRIGAIAARHMRDAVRIEIEGAATDAEDTPLVTQRAFVVTRPHKAAALGRILDVEAPRAALVFCRTRTEVDQLTETLNGRGYRAEALHGGMNQEGRDRVMGRLRSGTAELLIATDVAARGLDIDLLTHVVNYDVPSAPEAYVHRIGRVGRAGREGVAITLAEPRELRLLGNIERRTGRPIPIEKVPSVAELRARQLEATAAALRDALGCGRPPSLLAGARRTGGRPRRARGRQGGDQAGPRSAGVRRRRDRDPRVRAAGRSPGEAGQGRQAGPAPDVGASRRAVPGPWPEDPPLHQPRPARPGAARRPRRCHRQRVGPVGRRHRADQHHRQLLDGRRPGRRRRRCDRSHQTNHDPGQAPDDPP